MELGARTVSFNVTGGSRAGERGDRPRGVYPANDGIEVVRYIDAPCSVHGNACRASEFGARARAVYVARLRESLRRTGQRRDHAGWSDLSDRIAGGIG